MSKEELQRLERELTHAGVPLDRIFQSSVALRV